MEPYSHAFALPKFLSKSGQKPSLKMRVLFVFVGILFIFLIANGVSAAVLEGSTYPGVAVAGNDVGWKSRQEVANLVRAKQSSKNLTIVVNGKKYETNTSEIGAEYDADATADLAYKVGRRNLALLGWLDVTRGQQVSYVYKLNQEKLSKFAATISAAVGTPAINATIKVTNGIAEPVADQNGYSVNPATLEQVLLSSLNADTSDVLYVQPEQVAAEINVTEVSDAKNKANSYLAKKITLTYQGKNYTASPTNIGYWLTFAPKKDQKSTLDINIDQTQIKGWVQSVANSINIAPKNKKINIRNGVSTIEQEGVDGLAVDQTQALSRIAEAMANGADLTYEVVVVPVPFKTETNRTVSLDYARYIEVNLSQQKLWAYENNQVVYSSPVTSGATGAGFPTVTGLFAVYAKNTNTYLNGRPYGYNYNVFVKYWMPFYSGYGLHDASWRSSFGGKDYYYGGSHGCVNLPTSTAAFLYAWAEVGTPVWVHK